MRRSHVWLAFICSFTVAVPALAQPDDPPAPDQAEETGDGDDWLDEVSTDEMVQELEERLSYLEDAMDVVEKRAVLDRLQLGLDYRMILNSFSYRGPSPENPLGGADFSRTTAEVWTHRLRVPMRADINSSLRFTAQISMFKHFGDSDQAPFLLDLQSSRVPRDTALRVEHAWLDWFATDWLAISAGRLSYLGRNPPGHFKENTDYRIPTWGLNMIDGEYETITVTVNPMRSVLPDFYLRGFYASWFSDFDDPRGEFAFLDNGQANTRTLGFIADLKVPKLPRTYAQLGYFAIPRFPSLPVAIPDPAYDPESDFVNAPPPLGGGLLFPSAMPDSLGTYQGLSALVEVQDYELPSLDLRLDGFLGGTVGVTSPNDNAIEYELPNPADPSMRVSTPYFVMVGQGATRVSGALLAGVRVALPQWGLVDRPKVGFEYNYGSRYSLSFSTPTDQLVSKWTVRGQAFDTYAIVPVYRDRMFVRAGVLYIDNHYWTGLLGVNPAFGGSSVPPVDQDIVNFNLVVQVNL